LRDVTQLLTEHRDQLDSLAHALLDAETLDAPAAYAAAGLSYRGEDAQETQDAQEAQAGVLLDRKTLN
jgi:hypothetical protein